MEIKKLTTYVFTFPNLLGTNYNFNILADSEPAARAQLMEAMTRIIHELQANAGKV